MCEAVDAKRESPIHVPSHESIAACRLAAFIEWIAQRSGRPIADHRALEHYAIAHWREFWELFVEWCRPELGIEGELQPVCIGDECEHAVFFPEPDYVISDEERDILSYVRASPKGVPASGLNQPQFDSLAALVGSYVRRLPDEVAGAQLHDLERMGMDNLTFAWAGGTSPGDRHYYRVQGPTLLIEHDNTQGNGTHIHSAWRNPADDFGDDVLAAHYRTHHA